jgi:hypothetical protein
MKYVLVNDGTPCRQSFCANCREPIAVGYLREIGTRLPYCDDKCYSEHCQGAVLAIEIRERAS